MKVELVAEVVKVVEGGKQDDWLRPSLRLVWRVAYPIHVRAAAAAAAGGLVPGPLSYRSGTLSKAAVALATIGCLAAVLGTCRSDL